MGSAQTRREDTRPAARSPRRRPARVLVAALLLALAAFAAGFLWFASAIARSESTLTTTADGIVVLTGSPLRIDDAIELLAAGRSQRLLISGVHPSTSIAELVRGRPEYQKWFACCVELGHEAVNTRGNAAETARWAKERGLRSLIVVTSAWHMPRALLELKRDLKDVELIPYPVVTDRMRDDPWWSSVQTARLLFLEYVKYLASHVGVRPSTARMDPAGESSGQS
jgi:uncharacterized SAM-binding protein YcdF (DUF218 family)